MKNVKANHSQYKHKNLVFWEAMLESLSRPIKPDDVILDFGCGSGLFLQLLYEHSQYKAGYGIDVDATAIHAALQGLNANKHFPITYIQSTCEELLTNLNPKFFDVIFCQEVLWMNSNLSSIANTLFELLKPNGRCYCTVGCHAENPLWPFREERIKADGFHPYTYHLDEIAHVFSAAGFAVGMRRLPLDGFIMFHPEATRLNSCSFSELVSTTYEHKMLFYFGKTEPIEKPQNLYN